mmetsp:Transcript_4800/g.13790  ORF Transcript_4800/g.13790 Transcript_4800/m.13790 type:complete len:879 (+) Transcript_4800:326-2962(+)|eukprot:CAMPEP_0206143700 /NCGR_PEP_ID=MMETSP1473-20131121/21486_1 /ASSEMBLY_ACC=CAM_ASM_001109 /TAXON_ID=1461547 /ORGANISM="Stichococcus sp, Strain RCC1054" /LENGTH=878 /DNA_ID=CAMNT_0053539215 /DNA_START=255 /DNA_END=2891 /DNA_ORIENTATION=+
MNGATAHGRFREEDTSLVRRKFSDDDSAREQALADHSDQMRRFTYAAVLALLLTGAASLGYLVGVFRSYSDAHALSSMQIWTGRKGNPGTADAPGQQSPGLQLSAGAADSLLKHSQHQRHQQVSDGQQTEAAAAAAEGDALAAAATTAAAASSVQEGGDEATLQTATDKKQASSRRPLPAAQQQSDDGNGGDDDSSLAVVGAERSSSSEATSVAVRNTALAAESGRCPPLSPDVAATAAGNQTIILTIINREMLEMAWNWLEWLKHVGARNVLLASYQSDVDTHLLEWGVPCVDISEFVGIDPTVQGDYEFGTLLWLKIIWMKVDLLPELLRWGYHVIWSDVDVVWFKDPTRMLEDYPEVDVIMSTDCLCSLLDDGDDYFEDVRWSLREEWNSGTTFFRHKRETIDLAEAWKAERDAGREKRNQAALNWELLRTPRSLGRGRNTSAVEEHLVPGSTRLLRVFHRRLVIGVTPAQKILSGRTLSFQRLDRIMGIEPAAFHTTMVLGHWSKVARIKEAGLWRGEPNSSHYGHGNDAENFLAMDLVMPQVPYDADGAPFDQWRGVGGAMEAFNLAAIEFQLSQIAAAAHIAVALNRTLIFPKMACFCDWALDWAELVDCRAVGATRRKVSDFPLPYSCTSDTVIEAPRLLDHPSKGRPPIRHRFNGFLESPLLSPSVRGSQLRLRTDPSVSCPEAGGAGGGGCGAVTPQPCEEGARVHSPGRSGGTSFKEQQLETRCLPASLTAEQLRGAVREVGNVRVLHLGDAPLLWGGWEDSSMEKAVNRRLQRARFRWENRSVKEAEELGRGTNETYIWKPFRHAAQAMQDAQDGAIRVVPALQARPGPKWPQSVTEVLQGVSYKGTHPDPALWAIHDMPQTLWPDS